MSDRTVHAEWAFAELVRYDRSGKWYIEHRDKSLGRQRVKLQDAALWAVGAKKLGGTIYLGKPGGQAFDRAVLRRNESSPTPMTHTQTGSER